MSGSSTEKEFLSSYFSKPSTPQLRGSTMAALPGHLTLKCPLQLWPRSIFYARKNQNRAQVRGHSSSQLK